MVNEPNAEQYNLVVREFFIEGRDEEKSHVILEIAEPTPEERESHGFFIALAELSGATPKTIHMVRAWVEFAIDHYYAQKPTNLQEHFEGLLNALNMQSAVYLKQHQNETLHLLFVAVHEKTVLIGAHGRAAALILFHTRDGFHLTSLTDGEEAAAPTHLFSNVLEGTMRLDDRLLLATPRAMEFFTPDRIAKLSENKSLEEVADHMQHVLGELSSDFSFGVVWAKLVRGGMVDAHAPGAHTETPHMAHVHNTAAAPAQPQSIHSMTDLLHKTKSTASILAPPMLSFPKEKIVTTILRACRRSLVSGATLCVFLAQRGVAFLRTINLRAPKPAQRMHTLNPRERLHQMFVWLTHRRGWFQKLPAQRKRASVLVAAVCAVIVCVGVVMAVVNIRAHTAAAAQATITAALEKLNGAEHAFMYQNEQDAQQQLTDAEQLFSTVPPRMQQTQQFTDAHARFVALQQKIYHQEVVTVQTLASGVYAHTLVTLRGHVFALDASGTIRTVKNKTAVPLAHVDHASALFADTSDNTLVVQTDPHTFITVNPTNGATHPRPVSWLPQNSEATAAMFYSGRFYAYDKTTLMVYRYHKNGNAFDNGVSWITDSGKPTGIVSIAVDTSVWLLGNNGKILKYTAGKLQPFAVSGDTPKLDHTDLISTGGGQTIYLLDRAHGRLIATTHDGVLTHQYIFPAGASVTAVAIDEKETSAFGVTDDGKIIAFNLK